jgi:hypothetical protein
MGGLVSRPGVRKLALGHDVPHRSTDHAAHCLRKIAVLRHTELSSLIPQNSLEMTTQKTIDW